MNAKLLTNNRRTKLLKENAVLVDIETTGGNATYDRITEVAIITLNSGKLVSEWSTLINPLTRIPEHIQNLTGISNEMVRDLPSFQDVYKDIFERLSDCIFIAHNARFDYGFLKNEFKRCDQQFRAPVLCTVKLSRNLFPQRKRHNLDSIMQHHQITCSARHRALGDARVLLEFIKTLYITLPPSEVDQVIAKLLKRSSLPSGLCEEDIDPLPESPGVYLFYDRKRIPIYVGKSINIRDRVLSHFSGDHRSTTDMKISQNIASIKHVKTAGELGALLEEARLIKKLLPIYNRRLRRYDSLSTIYLDDSDFESNPKIITTDNLNSERIENYYGLFKSKKKAKDMIQSLAREHQLCLKNLGLEKGEGACFGYQINRCKGVCIGKESSLQHRIRLMKALQPMKNKVWPFQGRIGIREKSFMGSRVDIHLFENWCYLGTVHSESGLAQLRLFENEEFMFDLDTYKILVRYFKDHKNLDILVI